MLEVNTACDVIVEIRSGKDTLRWEWLGKNNTLQDIETKLYDGGWAVHARQSNPTRLHLRRLKR